MTFAPLGILRQTSPVRKPIAHDNPVTGPDLDGRESFAIEFTDAPVPKGQPSSVQTLPPSKQGQSSFYTPPPHYHLMQDEHFRVVSGSGIWHLSNKSIRLQAGDTITIPAWKYHWFENARDSSEPLKVGYWYTREYTEMEEKFFRNTMGYIADCTRAGQQPSVVQLCIFSVRNWMVIGVVNWQFVPDWFNFLLNTLITFAFAIWGEFVLGYAASYEQYYQPPYKTN